MEIHEECFASTKKGGQRKYVRKAYETSKQLAQSRKIPQDHPERYTLAMIADLESRINQSLGFGFARKEIGVKANRWLKALKEMYVFYERGYR